MIIDGIGLHGGREVTLELVAEPGPVRFERQSVVRTLGEFKIERTKFSTTIACKEFELGMVEHFFAALAGLGIRSGLRVVVKRGEEFPLLDGGAREFASALRALSIAPEVSRMRVAREAVIEVDGSRYAFSPASAASVEVDVDLPASCERGARFEGDARGFDAIASARTFVLERDADELSRARLARHVDPRSVIVVADDTLHGTGEIARDEPARHKLLDLIGDAYFHGGPPRGAIHATRPGHSRNHAAFTRARAEHVLIEDPA